MSDRFGCVRSLLLLTVDKQIAEFLVLIIPWYVIKKKRNRQARDGIVL